MQTKQSSSWKNYAMTVGVVLLVVMASIFLQFNYGDALLALPNSLGWITTNFYPTAESFGRLPTILTKLWETFLMAVASTTMASLIAFVLALFGCASMKLSNVMATAVRMIASFFRNVPDVVWSMIFLFSFKQGMMTGFLALFFVTIGLMTRAFIETIDEHNAKDLEAMDAVGATWWQKVTQAVIPNAIAGIISWILYGIENNVRSATLIGMLSGSGIGYTFDLYYKRLDFNTCALIVLCIVAVVLLLEFTSNRLRREIL